MNKIKDIIYDKSDILIAILILALAAIIILWRLGIILEYPKAIIGTDDATNVLTEPTGDEAGEGGDSAETGDQTETGETGEATETGESGDSTETETGESGEATETGETDEPEQTEPTASTSAQWDGDSLSTDLEVTLTGTTASAAVQCLVDAGVFADYAEYQKICGEMGYDHEKMRAGVFTFKKGSTKEDVIKAVNWSKGK